SRSRPRFSCARSGTCWKVAEPARRSLPASVNPKGAFMPARRREPRVLAREEPAELQVAATNGSIITDSRGRKYIDFVMGWCVGNFGRRPAAIAKAIERFKGPDYVYPGYAYAPWTELARLLVSLAPRPLTTCFRATGGSEAVDLALQAAM